VSLDGTGGVNDMHVVEIAPRESSEPEQHLYEEMVYILSGRGEPLPHPSERLVPAFQRQRF
jgi:hypothetical protein